jgi:hypothetical protein
LSEPDVDVSTSTALALDAEDVVMDVSYDADHRV